MKNVKIATAFVALGLVVSSCQTSQGTGTLIGAGGGAALGALAGRLIGGNSTGTLIGAAAGAAAGSVAGNLIGKHMDKVKAEAAAAAANANVETTTDANGLPCVKVTFDSGILFATGKYALNQNAKNDLTQFSSVLKNNTDCSVGVLGFTDSTGSEATNQTLSENRAKAVTSYLTGTCGVQASQIKSTLGYGENPSYLVKKADGSEDLAASRRVEIYLYASDQMIQAAQAGTLN